MRGIYANTLNEKLDAFKLKSKIINSEVNKFSSEPSLHHSKALKRIFFVQGHLTPDLGCQMQIYSDQYPFNHLEEKFIKPMYKFRGKNEELTVHTVTFSADRRTDQEQNEQK